MMRVCCGMLLLLLVGCTPEESAEPTGKPFAGQAVRLLVIDDASRAEAIQRVRTAWQERTGATLEVIAVAEIPEQLPEFDAVLFPSPLLGQLAERNALQPLSAERLESHQLAWAEVFEALRRGEARYGQQTYAIPLGSPTLLLMTNADLVPEETLPETWEELISATEKLPPETPAIALPLGDGWAGVCYLAIAAGYAKHAGNYSALFDPETMRPQLTSPPFVKALEQLKTLYQAGSPEQLKYAPWDVQQQLLSGKVAFAVGWPVASPEAEEQAVPIRFARLPGSREVYLADRASWELRRNESPHVPVLGIGGMLGGLAPQSEHPQAAWQLLLDVAKSDWSLSVRKASSQAYPSRPRHLTQLPRSFAEGNLSEYRVAYQESFSAQHWLDGLRIPGRARYLAALETEIQQTLQGKQTPQDALKAAHQAWEQITNELGREQQKTAYRRSIGMDF